MRTASSGLISRSRGMRLLRLLTATAALALFAAPAAQAGSIEVLTAHGEGTTTCTISVYHSVWPTFIFPLGSGNEHEFGGNTSCDVPVQQTGEATLPHETGPTASAGLCSGFVKQCRSETTVWDSEYSDPVSYYVTLIAPRGQGWVAAPDECSGGGTDNLKCTFQVRNQLGVTSF